MAQPNNQQSENPPVEKMSNIDSSANQPPIQPNSSQPPMTTATYQPASNFVPVQAPPTATPLLHLNEEPRWIDCPFCHQRTQTRVNKESSGTTGLASVLCCLVCICLACLPQMAGFAQNVTHFCTNCNKQVAYKPHSGQTQVAQPTGLGQTAPPYTPMATPAPTYQPTPP